MHIWYYIYTYMQRICMYMLYICACTYIYIYICTYIYIYIYVTYMYIYIYHTMKLYYNPICNLYKYNAWYIMYYISCIICIYIYTHDIMLYSITYTCIYTYICTCKHVNNGMCWLMFNHSPTSRWVWDRYTYCCVSRNL